MTATKTQILTQVQYDEIIQIQHIETRLKKNFQLIVDELRRQNTHTHSSDTDLKQTKQQLKGVQQNVNSLQSNAVTRQQLNRIIQDLKAQILKQAADQNKQLKQQVQQLVSSQEADPEKAGAAQSSLQQMQKDMNLMKAQLESTQKTTQSNKNAIDQLNRSMDSMRHDIHRQQQILEKDLAKLHSQLNNQRRQYKQAESSQQPANTQDMLQKLRDLEKRIEQLTESLRDKEKLLQTHTKQIWDMNEKVFSTEKSNDSEHGQLRIMIENLSKSIDNLTGRPKSTPNQKVKDLNQRLNDMERKIQLLLQSNDVMSRNLKGCEDQIQTLVTHLNNSSRNMTIIQNQSLGGGGGQGESKEYGEHKGDLKRELLLKINDQRREYMTLLKNIINSNDAKVGEQKNIGLEEAIAELKFMVGKKADEQNTRKAVVFLEKKINYIFNTFLNMSEDDARVARKNWFCLSCDRKLTQFTGKVGEHISGMGPKGGKLASTINLERNIQISEGPSGNSLTSRYNKSKTKLDLPSLHSNAKRT